MSFPSAPVHTASVEYSIDGTTTPITITAPASGNMLVLGFACGTGGGAITSIAGGGATTWTVARAAATNMRTEIWFGVVDTTPGTTVTVTHSSYTSITRAVYVDEWSGQAASSILGNTNTSAAKSTTARSGAITPAQANSLCVTLVGSQGVLSGSPGGGFTDETTPGATIEERFAYKVTTTIASQEVTYTNTNTNYGGVIAELKELVATSSIKTKKGLARASVKTFKGLAIASVKTDKGLA
jgi:hypothetical protein